VRRRRVKLAVACAAGALIAVILITSGTEREAPPAPRPPANATGFLDSVGVAMHFAYLDTSYAQQAKVLALLRELGVRHVREGVPVYPPALADGLRGVARLGIGATLVTDLRVAPRMGVLAATRVVGPRVDGIEGPNELDHTGPPDWRPRLARYMRALRASIGGSGRRVTLVGPSFVDASYYSLISKRAYDVASLHIYPGGQPPEQPLAAGVDQGTVVAPGRAIEVTETGYHNALSASSGQPPVSEAAAATYLPRALLASFAAGAKRTFIYELLDEKPDRSLVDPERHFGLVRQDFSPKPAFFAVRNLLTAINRSPGRAPTPAPEASISARSPVERLVLTRSDGSLVVAIWRPVSVWDVIRRAPVDPGTVQVAISWKRPALSLAVSRPTVSARPVMRLGSTDRLSLQLRGDVVLLSYH
jgi:hypothetical protein